MLRFSIRDLCFLTVIVAICCAWAVSYSGESAAWNAGYNRGWSHGRATGEMVLETRAYTLREILARYPNETAADAVLQILNQQVEGKRNRVPLSVRNYLRMVHPERFQMGGVMTDGDREAAYKALRSEADRLVRNAKGKRRKLWSDRLRALWKSFPELRGEDCPDAAAVLAMLAAADKQRAAMERFA